MGKELKPGKTQTATSKSTSTINTLELVSDCATKSKPKCKKVKRVRGRKAKGLADRRKGRSIVGKIYGKLTVLGEMGRDKHGHLRYACECKCGNQTIARRSKLLAKDPKQRTTSCGCVKAENFVKFNDGIAGQLPDQISSDIFFDRISGIPAWEIALKTGQKKSVVDGAVRITQRAARNSKWVPYILAQAKLGRNYADIAAKTGLPQSTIGWIVKDSKKGSRFEAAA